MTTVKKIEKGYYKGIYKNVEFYLTANYNWKGVLQTWVGTVVINGIEKKVYDSSKKYVIEDIEILIERTT